MEFQSNFIDNIRLLLKGKYVISDRDLYSLSDIIMRNGLGDIAEKGLLITLYHCLDSNNVSFPISYNYFKALWEKENTTIDFTKTLNELKDNNLISLQRVTSLTFFNAPNITRGHNDLEGEDKYLVVYGTKRYNEFKNNVKKLLKVNVNRINTTTLLEGVNVTKLDQKFKGFIYNTVKNVRRSAGKEIELESYTYDSFTNEIEFNFVITINDIKQSYLPNHKIKRIMKKHIKGAGLLDIDAYVDGNHEVFLSVKVDMRILEIDLSSITYGITRSTRTIKEEVNELLRRN